MTMGKKAGTTGWEVPPSAGSPGRRTGAREPVRKRALSRQLAVRFRWRATISRRSPTKTTASARCHPCPPRWQPSANQRSLGAQLRTVAPPRPRAYLVPRLRSLRPAASAGLDVCPATGLQHGHCDPLARDLRWDTFCALATALWAGDGRLKVSPTRRQAADPLAAGLRSSSHAAGVPYGTSFRRFAPVLLSCRQAGFSQVLPRGAPCIRPPTTSRFLQPRPPSTNSQRRGPRTASCSARARARLAPTVRLTGSATPPPPDSQPSWKSSRRSMILRATCHPPVLRGVAGTASCAGSGMPSGVSPRCRCRPPRGSDRRVTRWLRPTPS